MPTESRKGRARRAGRATAGAGHLSPRRAARGAVIGLVAGLLAVAAGATPLIESFERRSLDARASLFADPRRADRGIVAVVIDQKSLDAVAAPRERGGLGQGWPWPRDFYAAVLEYLLGAGARAVAFDLLFSEQSIYTQLGVADDDEALAAAAAGRPVLHSTIFTREEHAADTAWPAGLRRDARLRPLDARPASAANKATLPIPPLRASAAALGWIGFEPDEDGVCRSIVPAVAYAPRGAGPGAVEAWALPFALAALVGVPVEAQAGRPAAETLTVNGRRLPLDEDGRLLLRFHGGEGTYRQLSFAKVLESAKRSAAGLPVTDARPEDFRDKVVLIGATAAGLLDLRATSVGAILPGYLIHATAFDNLVHGDPLSRPRTATRAAVVVVAAALAGALVGALRSLRWGVVAALALAAAYALATLQAFGDRGLWLDLVPPALGIFLAGAGATGYAYLTEGRERRFLRDAFARYVAPEFVERLVDDPSVLALGGETRTMTVMFADVAGFTSLAEGRPPHEVVELMNECFTELTQVIQGHGGTVDKFIGDAVMAFWNAPIEQPDHAARACLAARDLLLALDRLNVGWGARGLPRISMRVGVATGPALVGNVGARTKFNYTVMGDTVNLASRLEGAAKAYHCLSLIASDTVAVAGGVVPLRELDWLRVKGRGEPVGVHEVIADPGPARDEAGRRYARGLALYREGRFGEAMEHFEAAVKAAEDDGPARTLLERCEEYLTAPPPDDWGGAYVLTSK
jgi:adenylate cyclase